MTDIEATKERLRDAYRQSIRYDDDGVGDRVVRTRIAQAYSNLGGSVIELERIEREERGELRPDEVTCD